MSFIYMFLTIPAIIIATTVHEATRGALSAAFGDATPKNEGRLSLNPLNHFEPIGFLIFFATSTMGGLYGVGWGKPVNTNSRYYNDKKTGSLLVAIVPSFVNFLVAVLAYFCMKFAGTNIFLHDFFLILTRINIFLVSANLLPCPPFDCYKVILSAVSKKNYFAFVQNESALQMVVMLMLFIGFLSTLLTGVNTMLLGIVASIVR